MKPSRRLVLFSLLFSIVLTYLFKVGLPEMNYFVRSGWVIVLTFAVVALPTLRRTGWRFPEAGLVVAPYRSSVRLGLALAISLVASHVIFH